MDSRNRYLMENRTFVRPEALSVENGKYRELLMDLRYSGFPYAPEGIDGSQEIMNVVEATHGK